MIRPKASFDFVARTHIFYLFLVFAYHGKATDAKVLNEFGCEFSDNDYSTNQADKKQPAWSNTKIDSKYNVDDYENIEDPFKQLFSEVNMMNTLSLFEELVRNYKRSNNKSFQSFFDNYKVPFQQKKVYYDKNKVGGVLRKTQDPASYLIQEIHTLQEGLKKLKGKKRENTPYLVSAYVDPIEVNFSPYYLHHIAPNVYLEKLHGKRVQDHLAGIIPIYIGNRTGYILIDPGYANGDKQLVLPFVAYVMDDERTPHGDYIRGTKSHRKERQFAVKDDQNGNPFILARHENPRHSVITHVIYSVGKPYCSFMENTIKPKLVRPYHEITKNRNGIQEGYLDFKITSGTRRFGKSIFTETSETNTLEPNEAFKTQIKSMFFTNSASSKEEVSVIIDQFKFFQTSLLDDRDFVAQLTGFTKSLGLDPEPETLPKLIRENPGPEKKSAVAENIPQLSIREKIFKAFRKVFPF